MSFYSLIAFDERATFWLQRVRSLPCATCACAYVALFVHRLAYRGFSRHCAHSIAQVVTTMAAMLDFFLCSITRKKKSNIADAVTILGDDVT